jgi:hypothetical protein
MNGALLEKDPLRFCYKGQLLHIDVGGDRHSWPKASEQYVYCWPALEEIGSVLFREEWTSADLYAQVPGLRPQFARANPPVGRVKSLSESAWERASEKWDHNKASHQRLSEALLWVGDELRNGRVIATKLERWQMVPLPSSYWFGVGAENAAWQTGKVGGLFLFLDRASLDLRLSVERQSAVVPATTTEIHLSPYMKLMHAVIRSASVAPNNQPSIDSLKAEMVRLAPNFGLQANPHWADKSARGFKSWSPDKGFAELSNRLLEAMPTLVREIHDQTRRG